MCDVITSSSSSSYGHDGSSIPPPMPSPIIGCDIQSYSSFRPLLTMFMCCMALGLFIGCPGELASDSDLMLGLDILVFLPPNLWMSS